MTVFSLTPESKLSKFTQSRCFCPQPSTAPGFCFLSVLLQSHFLPLACPRVPRLDIVTCSDGLWLGLFFSLIPHSFTHLSMWLCSPLLVQIQGSPKPSSLGVCWVSPFWCSLGFTPCLTFLVAPRAPLAHSPSFSYSRTFFNSQPP